MEEIKHLKDAPELSTREEMPKVALIRPNNMVFYKRNRYQMPYGTYAPNRNARIEVDDAKKQVSFYDSQTGEFLEKLPLSEGIGRAVRNTHPERNRTAKHKELLDKVLLGFRDNTQSLNPQASAFVENMLALKPRYRRFDLKWAEDESILRTLLRRIDDRRSPISNEIAIYSRPTKHSSQTSRTLSVE